MENITQRRIMWGDLDSLGIVFYPRYYEWMDDCGHLFFEAIGISHDVMWKDYHIVFGLVETRCRYFKPGRYHQKIKIITRIEDLNKKGMTLRHDIMDAENDSLMVEGTEKRLCMDTSDPANLRVADIPETIFQTLKSNLNSY